MDGAQIFVAYTSGDGSNVTVSPRIGTGYIMPRHNADAQITMLEGTGVSDGMMIANFKCTNCNSWSGGTMDFTDNQASWIHAAYTGSSINSDDTSATIRQHNTAHAAFNWDMTSAKGGSSVNPFVDSNTTPPPSTGGGQGNGNGNGNGNGGNQIEPSSGPFSMTMLIAHGVLASLAMVIFFPLGSITIRLFSFSGLIWVHAGIQMLALFLLTAAVGLGIYIATKLNYLSEYHPIIGLVVFALMWVQPIGGFLHHLGYKKHGRRTIVSHAHIWLGRALITLGMINGGLGLKLADNSKSGEIAYGVIAGVVFVAWVAVSLFGEFKRTRAPLTQKHRAAFCQIMDSIYPNSVDVPMSRVKFNVNTEYAYLQNFKILQNTFTKHQVDRPVPVESLIKCKMQDNLEFLQWIKRHWDQFFPGGDYDAISRRKASGAPPAAAAPRAGGGAARRAPTGGAAPRTRTPQAGAAAGGAASAQLRQENDVLKETVTGLERERDFYFSKLRDIELLIQQAMEAEPELEKDEGGLLKQIQTILYSTEEGFEIPAETEGEVEEETF
ncbi:hypothetical protein EJ05DRAFT_493018 [Pseudovirgaria hyperparasitica]|uniref:Cytochrome b561 domain-containing protein n=1 Tax=Pseudovirgaria hyperparasitica TaxID=470096 RepID=A0A6A6W7W8_9PEZI|nr:uncharacterized protein EJ05DRAFT_493018 [Pseudovirgaria hyperparasitica]KAF2758050.1 hypothetical protein EJ05DRAFT_493018 [Pseudovirgaria hyperparasitica]